MRSPTPAPTALLALLLGALLLPSAALAQGSPRVYAVQDGTTLGYTLIHKLHEVKGTARRVEDFDSGNANRDAHMKEATEASRFPLIEFKGLGRGVRLPARLPATVPVTVKGKLTFHGVTRDVEVPLQVTFSSQRAVKAQGRFSISLEEFGIERPSLLMVKVQDALGLELALQLTQEGA